MRYQLLTSLGATVLGLATTVSAGPLVKRGHQDSCPSGYTLSVYYETVAITPSTTPVPSPVQTPEPTTTTSYIGTSTEAGDDAASTSIAQASSSAAPVAEATTLHSQQPTVVVPTSTSETPQEPTTTSTYVAPVEPTTTSVVQKAQEQASTSTSTSTTEASTSSTSSTKSAATAASSSSSSSGSSSSETAGTATYYGGNLSGGACSFSDYTLPSGMFGTALSIDQWSDSANCGACVNVKGPNGNTIKAMIVDECPSCEANHFDLFENAFGEIAEIAAGVIDIDWEFTPCDLSGPLKLRNKSGTSEYWFSMQVINANEPVTKLEASTDGGSTWTSTTRTSYNYFEYSSGFGTDTVDVRVTGQSGSTVVVKNVSASSTSDVTASANL